MRLGRRPRRSALLVVAPLLATVALSGCGGHGSGGSTTHAAAPAAAQAEVPRFDPAASGREPAPPALDKAGAPAGREVQERAVISTGQVELTSDDVAATRDRVDGVLAREHGRIADENTLTDKGGTVTRAHLVLRVPSAAFDQTMTSLAGLATLRSSSRKAQDVTTQVIDVGARIAAQQAGVRRLRALVSRAANLPALLAVERELTARQGELESLLQQRAYLADETSLATITVDITRHTTPSPAKRSTGGFVGGFQHGWHALVTVVVGALVGLGAMLPFAVAAAVLGLPIWLVLRRLRRQPEPEAPPAET
jgi:hypothetical protein